MFCFTETHLFPDNDLDEISHCLPNRSILRSDSLDIYQSVLLEFDNSIFECVDTLCKNEEPYASLLSKSKNQVLNILLIYRKNNLPVQRFLEVVRDMALSKEINIILGDFIENYFNNRPITQGLTAINFVQLAKHPTHVRGGLIDNVYIKFGISTFAKTEISIRFVYYSDHDAIRMAFPELHFR